MLSTPTASAQETFWDRMAPKYARKPIADQAAYEEKLTKVASLLRPTDHVLEIGCGTGGTALHLAPAVARMTATDGSHRMIEIARSKLGADAPTNIAFHQADAGAAVEGQPFDVICAYSLLHLVEDLPAVLRQVRAQLKPGGLLISKTVCLKHASLPIRVLVRLMRLVGFAPHVAFLDEADLIRHLEDAQFEIEQTTHFGKGRLSPFIVARRPSFDSGAA